MECLFCRIANGTLDADIVYADEEVIAFHDINPVAPVHILIIPRQHLATANAFDSQTSAIAGKLLATASRIAADFGFSENGYRLVMNCNHDGGQTVYHVHLHLLAGRHFSWPPG